MADNEEQRIKAVQETGESEEFDVDLVSTEEDPIEKEMQDLESDVVSDKAVETISQGSSVSGSKSRSAVLREKGMQMVQREMEIRKTEQRLITESSLESLIRRKSVIYGRIVGVESNTIDGIETVTAVVFPENKVKMLIPYEEFYNSEIIDMETVDLATADGRKRYANRKRQMLIKTIGLDVPVCVQRIVEDAEEGQHNLIIVSRKEAAAALRKQFFTGRSKKAVIDQTYEATVISVSPHSLAATFNGVYFVKQQNQLTYAYNIDLREKYRPGDRIPFVLSGINTRDGDIEIVADTLKYERNGFLERQHLIKAGTVAMATIIRISRKKDLTILAWLPDYDIATYIAHMNANDFGRELTSGDEVRITVRGFRSSGFLDSIITSVQGNASLFNH